jgi:hypothetical protein
MSLERLEEPVGNRAHLGAIAVATAAADGEGQSANKQRSEPRHQTSRFAAAAKTPSTIGRLWVLQHGYSLHMAKDHGSSVKNDKQYEGLRKKGMSKSRAAAIANSEGSSSRGGKKSGSGSSSKSNSRQGGTTQQKKAAGRKGGKAAAGKS